MDLISLIIISILLLGIIVVLKKGFNEVIKGFEMILDRLEKLENKKD